MAQNQLRPGQSQFLTDVRQILLDLSRRLHLDVGDDVEIPVFYTLTKIHKPTSVGRPIISGFDGPTERISAFVDHLLSR